MAQVYLETGETYYAATNDTNFYGSGGDEQVILYTSGLEDLELNQNIEKIDLTGSSSDYQFEQNGNTMDIYQNDSKVTTMTVQADGSQIAFSNGLVDVQLNNQNVMEVGGTEIPSDSPASITPANIDKRINVSAEDDGSTYDANGNATSNNDEVTYIFAEGSYDVDINNFSSGDVLNLPDLTNASVENSDYNDGQVNVNWNDAGNDIVISLLGLDNNTDSNIVTVDDLNTEFGANTVVDQNIEGPTATALDDSGVINVDQSQTQEISTSLLLENDSGTDISVTDVSTGNISEDGTATLDGDTITFEAASDYTGPADFQYTVTNANDKTDTAMVTGDVASSSPVEGPTLELGDAQVEPGGTANLTLELNTPDNTDVASLSTDITYDSSVLSNFSASIGTAGEKAGKSIESSSPAQDTFRVGVLSFSTDPIPDGAVAELSFDIASDAEIGSEIELTQDASGSTPEAESVGLSGTSGIVEIVDQATSQNLEIMGVQESNASEMSLDIA